MYFAYFNQLKNIKMGWNVILPYMLLPLTILTLHHNCDSLAADKGDTLYLGSSLTANHTIISMNGTFELGFFSPPATNNWYIGIWYAKISEKTVVWVANRETPIKNKAGILNLTRDGHLRLSSGEGESVWSIYVTTKASRAVILDSGNFLVVGGYNKSETVWQSFDYPVDTWLPGMKFGGQQKLVCWKNSLDPAPGLFSLQADPSGAKQFVLMWNNTVPYWETGLFDRNNISQMPELILPTIKALYNWTIEISSSGVNITFAYLPTMTALSRLVLHNSGGIAVYSFIGNKWNMFWARPTDQCTVHDLCGAYAMCNPNNLQSCSCVEGFMPRDNRAWDLQEWWSSGCVRQRPLKCDARNGSSDGFNGFSVTLPDNSASSYPAKTKTECEKTCLRNCLCTAFSYNSPSGSCQIWSGDLLNMHNSPSKNISDVFVRVGASALELGPSSSSKRKTISIVVAVLGVVLLCPAIVLHFIFLRWRRRRCLLKSTQIGAASSDGLLTRFSFKELKIATENFRYKLGSGGFGSVFKGTLREGTVVAVKELECSQHGEKQFRAEISSVGNIHHVNLIRLRGFCAEGSERLLVYDYMPNGSLNSFLFSRKPNSERKVLDWKTRFEIALGTARALVYLHDKCSERIIHSDVKPENILLDGNFCPKLGDFGLAKLVGRDFSRVLTTTRGTRGYLAPEWISGLPITPKVDVYSFGMTLLEIISGRRTLEFNVEYSSQGYFPSWAAAQMNVGNMMNIVEESIAKEADMEEVRRAGMVSMLCIADDENARPSMAQVLLMLEGKMEVRTPKFDLIMMIDQQADRDNNNTDIDGIICNHEGSF